jgi:DNA-directed RNA polymerase specialized sigma24 family protein
MGGESDVSDEVLWRQVINGDGEAFGLLFDRHHERVGRHALKVLGVPHLAEEITAVVFYEAWRRRANIRMVDHSILPWLLVTANNIVRNHVRQQRRYRHFLSQLPAPEDAAILQTAWRKRITREACPLPFGKPSRSSTPGNATC